jgi:hypothetical protein
MTGRRLITDLQSVSRFHAGLFNLPGANRTQIQPIIGIQGLGLPPPAAVPGLGMGIGNNPNLQRQSRRLYIGSITPEINEQNLADLFNTKMAEMKVGTDGPGNPVLAVQCNYEKSYAFVEVGFWWRFAVYITHKHSSVPKRRGCHGSDGVRWHHVYQRTLENSSPQGLRWPRDGFPHARRRVYERSRFY